MGAGDSAPSISTRWPKTGAGSPLAPRGARRGAECAGRGQGRRLWARPGAGGARRCWRRAARRFFVAHLAKAEALRRSRRTRAFSSSTACRRLRLRTLCAADASFRCLARCRNWRNGPISAAPRALGIRAAMHIDTGMNRLGLPAADLFPARALMGDFAPVLAMSHFISAEDARRRAPKRRSSVSSRPAPHCRQCRLHCAIPPACFSTRRPFSTSAGPAMRFTAAIPPRAAKIRCGAWSASRRQFSRSAMSRRRNRRLQRPLDRALAPRARDHQSRLRRRFSAQRLLRRRSASRSLPAEILPGGRAHLDGPVDHRHHRRRPAQARRPGRNSRRDYHVDELATQAGTIGYEILTDLGRRFKRIYVGGEGLQGSAP